jgi:hypothetical protein
MNEAKQGTAHSGRIFENGKITRLKNYSKNTIEK